MKTLKTIKAIAAVLMACCVGTMGVPVYAAEIGQEIAALAQDGATSGTCGENLTWKFDKSTGTLTISGTGEMDNYDSYVNRCPWTGLEYTTAVIEEGVTSISAIAFENCESLTSVTIPSSVESIGKCTFSVCSDLASITIENPDCEIFDGADTFCNVRDEEKMVISLAQSTATPTPPHKPMPKIGATTSRA